MNNQCNQCNLVNLRFRHSDYCCMQWLMVTGGSEWLWNRGIEKKNPETAITVRGTVPHDKNRWGDTCPYHQGTLRRRYDMLRCHSMSGQKYMEDSNLHKKKDSQVIPQVLDIKMAPHRIELWTRGFSVLCSTDWAKAPYFSFNKVL